MSVCRYTNQKKKKGFKACSCPVSGTGLEKAIDGLYNNMEYQFKVDSKSGSSISSYTSEKSIRPTDKCDQTGADRTANRCYATQQFDFKSTANTVKGIKGKINFDDVNITSGFNQASYWLDLHGRLNILEVGIHDGSSSNPKFVCAVDGTQINHRFSTSPSNNVDYNFKIEKIGSYWKLYANNELCKTIRMSEQPDILLRGSETSSNNTPDFTQEFKDMKFKKNSSWKLLSSTYGTDSRAGLAYDFFIDRCGSGSEMFYNIETGKGTVGNC